MKWQPNNKFLWALLFLCIGTMQAQTNDEALIPIADAQVLYDNEENYKEWLLALETPGVQVEGDQMKFNLEAQRLIADTNYREEVYQRPYGFEGVAESIQQWHLQKAFWQMISLYPENKEKVVQYIYAYDELIPTDKVLAASFYTYAFFDPQITEITDGKPTVIRPDIFEEHLRNTNEIISYIQYLRKTNQQP